MELDELKKSWNRLDTQLQKEPIADEQQISQLIDFYKEHASKSLGQLKNFQRFSLLTGVVVVLLSIPLYFLLSTWVENEILQRKINIISIFIGITFIGGLWWDWKTYRWSKVIQIDEMPVMEVSRRMNIFRRWTRYEIIAACIWTLSFNVLYYWGMDMHHEPIVAQGIFITCLFIADALIIYFLYKKMVYKHLDHINKDIEELEDICTESH